MTKIACALALGIIGLSSVSNADIITQFGAGLTGSGFGAGGRAIGDDTCRWTLGKYHLQFLQQRRWNSAGRRKCISLRRSLYRHAPGAPVSQLPVCSAWLRLPVRFIPSLRRSRFHLILNISFIAEPARMAQGGTTIMRVQRLCRRHISRLPERQRKCFCHRRFGCCL